MPWYIILTGIAIWAGMAALALPFWMQAWAKFTGYY